MTHTVSEVLNKAADHIATYGLCKGSGHGPGNIWTAPACVLGALGLAADGLRGDSKPAERALRDYLGGAICLPDWSDDPERPASEVVEALRATALIEAAKENAETREAVTS